MPDEAPQTEQPKQSEEPKSHETTALAVQAPRYPMREMLTILKDTGDPDLFKTFAADIISREIAASRYGQDSQLARVFAASGAFDGIQGSDQGVALAMTKIQMGRSWNMEPADAMESVFFINGRPSIATRYLSAKMQDAGISWDIEWDQDGNGNCTGCHLHLKRWAASRNDYQPIMERINGTERQAVVSFTKRHADTAMVHEKGKMVKLSEKWNFQSWGEDMYFARCVSRVRTRYCPNVLSGVLSREEAEDSMPANIAPLAIAAARDQAQTEKVATATQARQAEVAEQLKQRAAAQAPPPPPPAPEQPAEAIPTQPQADKPWTDRAGMSSALIAEINRLGKEKFDAVLSKHKVMTSSLKHDDPKAAVVYADLKATAASAVTEEDAF